jgi:hypothetical protein
MECRTIKSLALALIVGLSLSSCYYDNVEQTYGVVDCDTSSVTFSQDIKAIIGQNCEGCHNGVSASGGLNLAGHTNIAASALTGSLMDRVERPSGDALLMPPGAPLSDCDQNKLRIWIAEGAPNN